jgi:hypothetical protein
VACQIDSAVLVEAEQRRLHTFCGGERIRDRRRVLMTTMRQPADRAKLNRMIELRIGPDDLLDRLCGQTASRRAGRDQRKGQGCGRTGGPRAGMKRQDFRRFRQPQRVNPSVFGRQSGSTDHPTVGSHGRYACKRRQFRSDQVVRRQAGYYNNRDGRRERVNAVYDGEAQEADQQGP